MRQVDVGSATRHSVRADIVDMRSGDKSCVHAVLGPHRYEGQLTCSSRDGRLRREPNQTFSVF